MLIVVRTGRVAEVRAVFDRYELHAAEIGTVTDEPLIRCRSSDVLVCEVAGRSLADDAPRYAISGSPGPFIDADLHVLADEPATDVTLLELLGAPNARDRKPIWRRYDHMNGTNTLVGPGAGDAALLRVKGTCRALALSIDGPGPARVGALDPYLAGMSAVVEGALNVACSGAEPIGITDCLNFGSPETELGAWQLERAIDGIADACRALDIPVVSGNVSLYNERPDGPILPTPVVGTVGLLDDRRDALPMRWSEGDEVWLLGEPAADAAALAGSELAWRRGIRGGVPTLDLPAAARLIRLMPSLAGRGVILGAHDCSVGGVGVGLARMAIASALGIRAEWGGLGGHPTASAFGERGGRVLVSVSPERTADLRAAADAAKVAGSPVGVAGGQGFHVRFGNGRIDVPVTRLVEAWRRSF